VGDNNKKICYFFISINNFLKKLMVTVTNARMILNDAQDLFKLFDQDTIYTDLRHAVDLNIMLLRTIGSVINSANKGLNKTKVINILMKI
jgi:hypothetical protein